MGLAQRVTRGRFRGSNVRGCHAVVAAAGRWIEVGRSVASLARCAGVQDALSAFARVFQCSSGHAIRHDHGVHEGIAAEAPSALLVDVFDPCPDAHLERVRVFRLARFDVSPSPSEQERVV